MLGLADSSGPLSVWFGRQFVSVGGNVSLPRYPALRQDFFFPLLILMLPREFCKSCGLSHTCRFSVLHLFKFLAGCCCFYDSVTLCLVAYL